jgi:large subunit ribosomal protein L10
MKGGVLMKARSNKSQDIKKAEQVKALYDSFQNNEAVFLTDFRGISVEKDTVLRAKMREAGIEYTVAKNTLIKRAYDNIKEGELDAFLAGPTSLSFAANPVELAKLLTAFMKENKVMTIKAGLLNGKLIDAAAIENLSRLPSRDILLSQVLRAMQAPLAGFAGVTSGMLRQLITVVDRIREQKEAQN